MFFQRKKCGFMTKTFYEEIFMTFSNITSNTEQRQLLLPLTPRSIDFN